MLAGDDQVVPLYVTAYFVPTAAQKLGLEHDTDASPPGLIDVGEDHATPLYVRARPELSTATQKVDDTHETEIRPFPPESIIFAADHTRFAAVEEVTIPKTRVALTMRPTDTRFVIVRCFSAILVVERSE